jgi:hypothetical protein
MPPRSSGGGTSLAIAIGVGVLFFTGSVALFFVRSCKSVPPPPDAPTVGPAKTAPPPLFPTAETDDEPVPPDGPPGSPQASAHARPPWGKLDHLTIHAKKTDQFAPQLSRPHEAFQVGTPLSGDLESAFVVCRAESFGKNDTFAGDDLHVRATFGAMPEIANDGPEDKNLGYVSAPHITFKKGEVAHFEVFDRDVLSMALITRAAVTYGGGGMTSSDSGANIECRSVSGAPLAKLVDAATKSSDEAIGKISHVKLDGTTPSWGWPLDAIQHSTRAAGDVAAFVGWEEPRAKTRAERVTSALRGLEDQKKKLFADLHASAGADAAAGGLAISGISLSCETPGILERCTIKATLKNDSDKAIQVPSYIGGYTLYVATERTGPILVTSISSGEQAIGEVAAHATIAVSFGTSAISSSDEKAIVGVCTSPTLIHDGGCKVARVK